MYYDTFKNIILYITYTASTHTENLSLFSYTILSEDAKVKLVIE